MNRSKSSNGARIRRGISRVLTRIIDQIRYVISRLMILLVAMAVLLFALVLAYSTPSTHPVSTLMLARYVTGKPVDRRWVGLKKINPVLVYSVMMSEDAKFCAHSGVDWDAMTKIIDSAIEGEKTRGASTLSMQVVKNLFLWPGRSYLRKGIEVPLALVADALWTKRRMVEIYLNIAEWGEGIYGIEAASRRYFKRSAANLNAGQSALLAVTLPNPIYRNPARPTKKIRKLAKKIQIRAFQSGAYINCIK